MSEPARARRRKGQPDRQGELLDERYQLLQQLGEGGMGTVYEAEHLGTGRRVAVKLLHADLARDDEMLARFRHEARAAAALGSEHATAVLDLGEAADGTPFLVMELLAGETLRSLLTREQRLPLVRVARLIVQACHALAEAHARGTVHRDLKPENLFITRRSDGSDCLKLLDFGVAKLAMNGAVSTRAGAVMGTALYMSPEQARGAKDVDARSDIYSLAAIVYEALTGMPPHESGELHAVVYRILHEPITPLELRAPGVPAPVSAFVGRCLARDADARPRGVIELARALEPYAAALPTAVADAETVRSPADESAQVASAPDAVETRAPSWVAPAHRTRVALAGVLTAIAVAAISWWVPSSSAGPAAPVPSTVVVPTVESEPVAKPTASAPAAPASVLQSPRPSPAREPPAPVTASARPRTSRTRGSISAAPSAAAPIPASSSDAPPVRDRVRLGF